MEGSDNRIILRKLPDILRIIEELQRELKFIREELHINSAGPCTRCGRMWLTSPRTGRVTACAVCNVTLCPSDMKPRCSHCKWRCCDQHWHSCQDCVESGGTCVQCLQKCDKCGLEYCYAMNHCDNDTCINCPNCWPVKPCVKDGAKVEYCAQHSEGIVLQNK